MESWRVIALKRVDPIDDEIDSSSQVGSERFEGLFVIFFASSNHAATRSLGQRGIGLLELCEHVLGILKVQECRVDAWERVELPCRQFASPDSLLDARSR